MDLRGRQRAVLLGTAAAVLLVGLLAVALPDRGNPRRVVQTAGSDDPTSTTSEAPTTTVTAVPTSSTSTSTSISTTTTVPPILMPGGPYSEALASPDWLVGRAVDVEGNGVEGVFVYSGLHDGYARPDTRTLGQGYYQLHCPTAPVVLMGAQINTWAGDHTLDANWAPVTVVGVGGAPLSASCGSGKVVSTTVRYGGVIEGVITGMGEMSGASLAVAVDMPWPGVNSQGMPMPYFFETLVWRGEPQDGAFRAIGLPPGDVVLYRAISTQGDAPLEWVKDVVHVDSGKVTKVQLQAPSPSTTTTTTAAATTMSQP